MGFGWPLGLAALVTLLVPVLIHLARQRPRRPVLVGSLRHLPDAAAPRRARSQVVEPWLLALRMLILALLALIIAQPFVRASSPAAAPRSLLVLPAGFDDDSLRALLPAADSLLAAGHEIHRLPMADLWSELSELDAGLPEGSSIAVVAPFALAVTGARPAVRSAMTLHRFDRDDERSPVAEAPRALHVRIVSDASTRIAAARHAAAFRAVAELRGDSLVLNGPPARDGWIVWLTDSVPAPTVLDEVRNGATLLTSTGGPRRDAPDAIRAERLGRGRVLRTPLVANPAVDATFAELIARIWPDPERLAPTRPARHRISTNQLLPSLASPGGGPLQSRTSIGNLLLGAVSVLFLLERWLSHRAVPGQRPVPRHRPASARDA